MQRLAITHPNQGVPSIHVLNLLIICSVHRFWGPLSAHRVTSSVWRHVFAKHTCLHWPALGALAAQPLMPEMAPLISLIFHLLDVLYAMQIHPPGNAQSGGRPSQLAQKCLLEPGWCRSFKGVGRLVTFSVQGMLIGLCIICSRQPLGESLVRSWSQEAW